MVYYSFNYFDLRRGNFCVILPANLINSVCLGLQQLFLSRLYIFNMSFSYYIYSNSIQIFILSL